MMPNPLTGRHVAAIFGSAFLVIIAVNLTLATQAVRTFPGLEVKNSYIASQSFDRDRAAQEALGWVVSAEINAGKLFLHVDGPDGPVQPQIITARLGRATHVGADRDLTFLHDGSRFESAVGALAPGNWNLRLEALSPEGTEFRQRIILEVPQ